MAHVLGIDLGTTNSCVAVWRDGRAQVIDSAEKDRTTPTAAGQPEAGKWHVGAPARWQAQTNPEFTFSGLKRILGRPMDDPLVIQAQSMSPFGIEASPDGFAWVRTRDGLQSPQAVLAHVLRKLRGSAEAYLGAPATACVMTIPAYFGMAQKAAAKEAAAMAGLQVVRLLPEPSAAALAYGLERGADKTIAVFDLGGGTFDVSILKIRGRAFTVLATDGDQFLGGDDWDNRIIDAVAQPFREAHGVDLRADRVALQRLRDEAEKAKIRLSSLDAYDVALPWIALHPRTGDKLDVFHALTRESLEELTRDLVARLAPPCDAALTKAKLTPRDLDEVVLVGGMTAMPAVREAVRLLFGRAPRQDVSPECAVAIGAAIRGAALTGEIRSITMNEPLPHSVGLELADGGFHAILKRGAVTPVRKRADVFTTSQDGQEAVAIRLYEGDLAAASDNRALGVLVLDGITPRPAGEARIDVTLDVDADGMLTAEALDLDSRETVSASLHLATGFDPDAMDALAELGEAA